MIFIRIFSAFMLLLALAHAAASEESPADLVAVIDAAMTAQGSTAILALAGDGDAPAEDADTEWLAAPPSFSASYLASDQSWGTDETELSVSLPLQSPEHRRRNDRLRDVDPQLKEAAEAVRRWQLSGWLRDLYARRQRAALARDLAAKEEAALVELGGQAEAQQSAGSLAAYDLWVIRQELRAARTRRARRQAELARIDDSYAAFTGFTRWPEEAGEPAVLPPAPRYGEHPQARLMNAVQEQNLAALRAGSASLTPWNLGLVGREFSMADRTEWQYGVSVSIPLGGGEVGESVAVRSSERALRRQFLLQLDRWRADLQTRWAAVAAEREALLTERELLRADDALGAVGRQLDTLALSAEVPIENRVQRRLALLRAQSRPQLLAAELAATEALMRQIAGDSL